MNEVLKQIKKKELKPLYFLHGDEQFFIEEVVDRIQERFPNMKKDLMSFCYLVKN